MMKRVLLLILLSLQGCATISPVLQPDLSQDLFVQVLEAPAPQSTEAMAQLENDYPQSPWATRAKTVHELRASRDTLKNRIRELERTNASQASKNQTLHQEAERLRSDLEKLKQVIIDMEKRSAI